MNNSFKISGQWYKGNLHSHSTNSDGLIKPDGVPYIYKRAGYDFLVLTDHWQITDVSKMQLQDFLILPGAELHAGQNNKYHIVGIGIDQEVPEMKNAQKVMRDCVEMINKQNGLAILAHPYWSGLNDCDMSDLDGIIALEVYNTGCDYEICRGYSEIHWDNLLSSGIKINAVAVDDTHVPPFDILQGWVMVKANSLDQASILEALKEGNFYSSCGPEILDIDINDNSIHVQCSPVKRIDFVSNPTLGHVISSRNGQPLTSGDYKFHKKASYVRIQIEDFEGRKAWSNPFYLK